MTQWTIQSLTTPTKFQGLGQLKNTLLQVETCVLSAGDQILAIPGISGGQSTSLNSKSKEFVLEVASFNAQEVARNSFRINYRSEASKVYAESPSQGLTMSLVLRMYQELAQDYSWKLINQYKNPDFSQVQIPNSIQVDFNYISNKLDNQGLKHWQPIIETKLNFLGKYDKVSNLLTFNRFYQSIKSQDNLLSELIRMIGLENLASQDLELSANNYYNKQYDNLNLVRNCLTKFGFDEVISRPFVSGVNMLEIQNSIQLLNPYSELEPFVRDNLIITLISTYQKNLVRGEKQPKVFEINQVYNLIKNQPQSSLELSLVWDSTNPYLGTSIVHSLGQLIDGADPVISTFSSPKLGFGHLYQYSKCSIKLIQITNTLKKQFDLPLTKTLWAISLQLNGIEDWTMNNYKQFRDISDYPSLSRDYSLLVPKNLQFRDLKTSLIRLNPIHELKVTAIERFEVDESTDKLNISIQLNNYERTPSSTDLEEVEKLLNPYQK